MRLQIIETIPETCSFCNKKAEYWFYRNGFFRTSWRFLCKEHQLMITKIGFREFERSMNPFKVIKDALKKVGLK